MDHHLSTLALSSSGLGRKVLILVTPVQIWLGPQAKEAFNQPLFCLK